MRTFCLLVISFGVGLFGAGIYNIVSGAIDEKKKYQNAIETRLKFYVERKT